MLRPVPGVALQVVPRFTREGNVRVDPLWSDLHSDVRAVRECNTANMHFATLCSVVLIAVTGGCAGGGTVDAGGPGVLLRVVVTDPTARPATRTFTVTCAGDDDRAGCRALRALPAAAFLPPAPGTVCTEIYGGPGTAVVTGTIDGRAVDASFSRVDGCRIASWDAVVPHLLALAP